MQNWLAKSKSPDIVPGSKKSSPKDQHNDDLNQNGPRLVSAGSDISDSNMWEAIRVCIGPYSIIYNEMPKGWAQGTSQNFAIFQAFWMIALAGPPLPPGGEAADPE